MSYRRLSLLFFAAWLGCSLPLAVGAGGVDLHYPQTLDDWSKQFSDAGRDTDYPTSDAVYLLRDLNAAIRTPDDIMRFRDWAGDDDAVKLLLPWATGRYAETRIPATLILGNVVDNTNVCHLIVYLERNKKTITPDGRFNLLQVLRQVSSYALVDTAPWIDKYAALAQRDLEYEKDTEKTRFILRDIQDRLSLRTLGKDRELKTIAPAKYEECSRELSQLDQ